MVPAEIPHPHKQPRVLVRGAASFATVRDELKKGKVVCARIGWSGGGGHFMAIDGCSTVGGAQFFEIDDPIYGQQTVSVDTFTNSYQGSGSWTHTYFTKSGIVLKIKPFLIKEPILRKIWEIRPLLALKSNPDGDFSPEAMARMADASLASPHLVFTMGLDAVADGQQPPADPTSMRVMAVENSDPVELFDLTTDQDDPQIRQVAGKNPFLGSLARGFQQAAEVAEDQESDAELRVLQIPGLYLDAVWLHYDNEELDVAIPVRDVEGVTAFQPIGLRELLHRVAEPARMGMQMDDTMGS
ncbi:MAG: hypothetical protein WD627_02325 [Actinomycetota bacterium]